MDPRRSLSLVALAALAALSACAWSVPADPGTNARLRGTPAAWTTGAEGPEYASPAAPGPARAFPGEATDEGARSIYLARCSACHEPFPPTHASPAEWPMFVRKYGPRAGLFGADRERVTRWLQANSR